MATIKNRKKAPLRGAEIVSRFPKGITVYKELGCRAEKIITNPLLLQDPLNEQDMWYVDIATLCDISDKGEILIKPEFATYPLRIQLVYTLR